MAIDTIAAILSIAVILKRTHKQQHKTTTDFYRLNRLIFTTDK